MTPTLRFRFGSTPHPDPPPQGGRGDFERRVHPAAGSSSVWASATALALALSLSGCFQPLYGEAAHPGLVDDLRAVEVSPISGRLGHYLVDDLITELNGTGQKVPSPKYRLTVTVATVTQTPTVNSTIGVASSATLTGEATYTLTKVDGDARVLAGTAQAAAAYDRTAQRYADLRAARDAEIRLARALSSAISTRLASALAAKSS
ncbi:MAG: hypothetical protein JO288_12340 [Hyphomicrobiales bacterium]|nr:hypothetical protein [Hyphomicrobiales bacterium]